MATNNDTTNPNLDDYTARVQANRAAWTYESWWDAVRDAEAKAPASFASEADYRAYCEASGAQTLDRYAANYGDFRWPEYDPSWKIGQLLYRRITEPASRQVKSVPTPAATCPGCGVQGNPRTWSSTAVYGPACPDCYDRLSE